MKTIFKGLLTLDALLIVVYMVKSCIWLPRIDKLSVVIYLLIPLIIARMCVELSKKLSKDSIEGGISGVELANESFLPSYAGYFFVALSVPDKQYITLFVVFWNFIYGMILGSDPRKIKQIFSKKFINKNRSNKRPSFLKASYTFLW